MKTCCDCKKQLALDKFVAKTSCKDGYEPRCRNCRSIKYNKSTPELFCKKVYNSQINHSATRNHPLPAYTLSELIIWTLSQPDFVNLYGAWASAGYPKDIAPSVDRIDDNIPYVISNLQLLTWEANRAKGAAAKASNKLLVNHRGVTAYNKDGSVYKTYLSMAEAMREFGGKPTSSFGISSVCNGIPLKDSRGYMYTPKTYKGYLWKWTT